MIKHKHKSCGKFIVRLYLAIVIFFVSFFTIFAYRFDVLEKVYPDHKSAFRLSEEQQKVIEEKLYDAYFSIVNAGEIGEEVNKVIPEYDFSIYTFKEIKMKIEAEVGVALDEINIKHDSEHKYFYMMYGNAPYKTSSKYSFSFVVSTAMGRLQIVLYPKFTSFMLVYIQIDLIISLIIVILFYLMLKVEDSRHYFKKLLINIQKQLKWSVFHKLSLKLLLLNILAGVFAFGSFFFMYSNRYAFFEYVDLVKFQNGIGSDYDKYVDKIRDKAKSQTLSKDNKRVISKLLSMDSVEESFLFDETGLFFTGSPNNRLVEMTSTRANIYDVSAVRTPKIKNYKIEFKDQRANLVVYGYPLLPYAVPYVVLIAMVAITMYLIPVIGFFNRKVRDINKLQEDVLVLANGDLEHEVKSKGRDEIAVLGDNINKMREMLYEYIQNEEQSRKNNSELITSMSHDLRTPLTSLKAYLEVIKYRKYTSDEQYEKCLERCIAKAEDIKEMSDAMFEYSLVFEPDHQAQLEVLALEEILPQLIDHMEQLEMMHYQIHYQSSDKTCRIDIDQQLMKRIFNNIFSNINKYADKSMPIDIQVDVEKKHLKMIIGNHILPNIEKVERNHIGLKSTLKMASLMKGELTYQEQDEYFVLTLILPIK